MKAEIRSLKLSAEVVDLFFMNIMGHREAREKK